jgi:hypothetical protein
MHKDTSSSAMVGFILSTPLLYDTMQTNAIVRESEREREMAHVYDMVDIGGVRNAVRL